MLNTRTLIGAGIALTMMVAAGIAQAAPVIYALDDNSNTIFMVNTSGGALGSFAAPNPVGSVAGLTIAEGGSSLLFTDQGPANPLFRLNPLTGAVMSTHALGISNRGGLSYDSTIGPGTILSINNGAPIISQAGFGGPTSSIGPAGASFPGGLGGDDQGRHFAAFGSIREINPITGAILNTLANPTGGQIAGLAYDGVFVYAAALGSGNIFQLNANTGAIVSSFNLAGTSIIGLAARNVVPEPATLTLFGLGLLGLGAARRRKKLAA